MKKNSRGFTLVEAIVVAVIIAILSAIAIPVYLSYVTSTKRTVVDNLAETAAAAASSYYRKTGQDPTTVSQLNIYYDNTKHTVSISPPNVTVFLIATSSITKTIPYR